MPLRTLGRIPLALWVQALLVFAIVVTLVLVATSTGLLLDNARKATQQRADVARQARLLVECTTPPRLRKPPERHVPATDCYARQQTARASLLGDPPGPINTVVVAAAACGAAHPGNIKATRSCVKAALGQEKP